MAIFAVNDNTAIGALSKIARHGLSVPFDQIALEALDLLNTPDIADHDRIRVVTPSLIPRRSTAAR